MSEILLKRIGLLCLVVVLGYACQLSADGPDVSHIEVDIKPKLFFIDLFELDENNLEMETKQLYNKYGSYLTAYSQRIIKIGSPDSPDYTKYMQSFLNYEDNKEVYKRCKEIYANNNELNNELNEAFKHYKYYFPTEEIPNIYLHTSYFNQSIAIDSGWVSVSVEKYLGADCEFYEWLAVPKYLRKKMVPTKVVPDVMKAMAMSNHLVSMKNEDVLSKMIHEAKLPYFVKAMMPSIEDSLLFDYTKDQIKWCNRYESNIWASMVEHKHLYNSERMVMQKYVGESPFTYYFGQESPGQAAVFLGYQIIKAFMKNNPSLGLRDLLKEDDAHKILREARYRP